MTLVAIDGPAGSGKSTVAAALAERLGIPHVDTGAFYRAATLIVLRAGVPIDDGVAASATIAHSTIERRAGRTFVDGVDVEDEIRGAAVTAAVSAVSAHPMVRAVLQPLQRGAVTDAGAVVEGRDAGTAVVPDADLKVWLTATPQQRAARRAAQVGRADPEAIANHAADLARRDALDAARMVRAPDVVEVDTTGRSVESLVDDLAALARSRAKGSQP